ncbi:GGDEF domain-containing protein [Litoribrevibacter albus]|uniref:diguanylate cyclase n=1 Tax=Litoribrevibacter albus TaxID=1473156 RepID=A0AA37S8I4_9GAMM|nr:GGDEF domain-containing protein [Litoribrevibacter albus]GLQ31035.1 GGDEF domain-containing protein [Litoribrevibacter albus]
MDVEHHQEDTPEYKRVSLLYSNSIKSVPATILNSSILLVLFWTKVPWLTILVWYSLILTVSIFRLQQVRKEIKNKNYLKQPANKALNKFILGSSFTGAIWGASFVLFNLYTDEAYSLLMIWIVSATAMGGSMSLAPSQRAQNIFVCLIFIPAIIMNILSGNEFNITMGTLCILFLIVMIMLGNTFSTWVNESLKLQYQNQGLLKSLQQKNESLETTNSELIKTKEFLTEQTMSDPLTGIANRRSFDHTLIKEWNRCLRRQYPLSCILIDIDYFKRYNDHYGHQQGDQLLRQVANLISSQATRADDLVARYGGEEFIVILSNASHDDAVMLAERTRKAILDANMEHTDSQVADIITISAGVATITPTNLQDCYEIVHKADEKLYEAKNNGRNQVC